MKTPLEKILFESDDMEIEDIKKEIDKLIVQKKRWLGTHHPDNKVRVEAFRSSGLTIGKDVFISMGMVVLGYERVYIGDRVAFGNGVSLITGSKPNNSLLNYHYQVQQCIKEKPIKIGEDSWIGTGTTILPDIEIGKMSIIGANSLVNRNVEEYSVYAGSPIRLIRRLDKEYADIRQYYPEELI